MSLLNSGTIGSVSVIGRPEPAGIMPNEALSQLTRIRSVTSDNDISFLVRPLC